MPAVVPLDLDAGAVPFYSRTSGMNRINDYFVRGYRRSRDRRLPFEGDIYKGPLHTRVQFFLDVHQNTIEEVSYQSSTCVVLVAYSEYLAELAQGIVLPDALEIEGAGLIRAFPEVVPEKYDCADLATRAFHSVVRDAIHHSSTNPSWSPTQFFKPLIQPEMIEIKNESSLHICHAKTHGILRSRKDDPPTAGGRSSWR